ncbi:hypothetical protein CWB99_13945 [Pseudoalteromonas rubra]|uniref:OmpR/PhoB-type domain-containing protein n=1 Tax=Pseudoalteromonas rubra TaxID=43658 RepID=A0A5S3WK43_9GAMM|nr:winged helix-turn-helix domain-containing protein [Pseudoalteromonas rubra]TMP27787.1 hypothetical protein CWB99_13945 [Pseudoalteromonas rubra]TMP32514.1 hypothetical protein CWC00_12595 [Pseudoalteromonas rubra]
MSDIYFADYRFDLTRMALYQTEYRVPLKPKQALLLHLLLTHHKEIVSKTQILDEVWGETVVSEQVIFQTISQLRSILGDDAIHTYARLGYQWQWPVTESPVTEKPVTDVTETPIEADFAGRCRVLPLWVTAVLLVCLSVYVAASLYDSISPSVETQVTILHKGDLEAGTLSFSDIAAQAIDMSGLKPVWQEPGEVSLEQAFETPELLWSKGQKNWQMWGKLYPESSGVFIHYGIARPGRVWEGYVYALDESELAASLTRRLTALKSLGLFADNHATTHELAVLSMSRQAPDDPELILAAGLFYIEQGQFDLAITYLDRLIEQFDGHQHKPYVAMAHWHKGKVYKMRSQHVLATASLRDMSAVLHETQLEPLKHRYVTTQAWLSYELGNWSLMNQVLDQALTEIMTDGVDGLRRFELHILYSILAKKTGQVEKQYHHLNLAQSVLTAHELDRSNQAIVLYHFAIFSGNDSDAEPYLKQVVALPRTGKNYWVQDEAMALLVEYALAQGDYEAAHALIQPESQNPRALLLKAQIHAAQAQEAHMMTVLKRAFTLAQQRFDGQSAQTAALRLYRASSSTQEEKLYYLAYLKANTGADWLRHQQISERELAAL